MANPKVSSNSGERVIQNPVEKPEKKPPFIDVTADPDYLKLVEYYQHAEFEKCGDLLNSLIKRYPDNLKLVDFQKDLEMQLSLRHISTTYSIKEKQEKKKLTIRMSAFTIAGIALMALVFAASFWFLSRAILDQRRQNQAVQLASLETQVNELLQTGQPQVAAGIIEKMYDIDANYSNLPVLSERTNFLLTLESDYQNAITLMNNGDYNGALLILRDISSAQSGLWDVDRQISKAEKKVQVTAFLQAGNDAYLSGKWGEVITAYESALEQDPSLNDGLMKEQLLNSYLRRIIQMLESDSTNADDIEVAEAYYRKAVAMIPQSRAFASERENLQRVSSGLLELKFTQIAKGLLEQKNQTITSISQAVGYLNKAANLDPNNSQLQVDVQNAELYQIAFQYYLDMNWGLTIDNLNQLVAVDQNYANGNAKVLLYEAYYATGNTTGIMSTAQFSHLAGVKMIHVPYKGEPQALTDLIAGRVQFMVVSAGTVVPHIREGKLRPLAVITSKRSPILPDVPTLGEAGMPQFSITSWAALYGPAKLPSEIVARLNKEFLAAAQRPEVQNVMEKQAFIFVGSTPEKLGVFTKEQNDEYKAMMRATGMEPE